MIILYTTHCPKCKALARKLQEANINYEICEDVKVMEEKGFSFLPVLEVNGEAKDFSTAMKWVGEQHAHYDKTR